MQGRFWARESPPQRYLQRDGAGPWVGGECGMFQGGNPHKAPANAEGKPRASCDSRAVRTSPPSLPRPWSHPETLFLGATRPPEGSHTCDSGGRVFNGQ